MEKKIVGFKLIKEYPGSSCKELNEVSLSKFWYNREGNSNIGYSEYNLLNIYSEFWEPIYEGRINLEKIFEDTAGSGIGRVEFSVLGKKVLYSAMKEACKQTLELVINELPTLKQTNGVRISYTLNVEEIRNLINKIK